MAERYIILKKDGCERYCAGSPVIVSAYALLQDRETGAVLFQLKMQSAAEKTISAVILEVKASDITGKALAGLPEYQFLDLAVERDMYFGAGSAIRLPDATTRDVTFSIKSVIFSDGAAWSPSADSRWLPIPGEKPLPAVFEDLDLQLFFQQENGEDCVCEPAEYPELRLWRCAAGHLNAADEPVCHRCGRPFFRIDIEECARRKQAHDEAAAAELAIQQAEAAARRKRMLRIGSMALAAAAVVLAAVLSAVLWIPLHKAQTLYDAGEYVAAFSVLEKVPGARADELSESCLAELEKQRLAAALQKAQAFFDAGQYPEAIRSLDGVSSPAIDALRMKCRKCVDAQFLADLEIAFIRGYNVRSYNMYTASKRAQLRAKAELDILEKYVDYSEMFYDPTLQKYAAQYISGVKSRCYSSLNYGGADRYASGCEACWEALDALCSEYDLFSDDEYFRAFVLVYPSLEKDVDNDYAYYNYDLNSYAVSYVNRTPYRIQAPYYYGVFSKDDVELYSEEVEVNAAPGETVYIPLRKLGSYGEEEAYWISYFLIAENEDLRIFDASGEQLLPREIAES